MKFSKESVRNFLDNPSTPFGISVRIFIIILIIVSVVIALIQILFPWTLTWYDTYIHSFEKFILVIFTLEFVARLLSAISLKDFVKHPSNWIDLLAIAPFYFWIDDAVILRLFRILRIFKVVNSINILKSSSAFDWNHSILRIVSPVISIFIFIKLFIWILEYHTAWIPEVDLKTLFTIIGFSLWVILSQKIWRSYGKYVKIQDSFYSLHWKLSSLQNNINLMSEKKWDSLVYKWLDEYMKIYYQNKNTGSLKEVRKINHKLFENASKIWNTELIPFHRLSAMMLSVFELAVTIQCKRINRTPRTYNLMLQQVILLYLLLLAVFIPWFVGMISVIFWWYLLYGMFQLTNDFDDVRAPSKSEKSDLENGYLITLDAVRIENYLKELREINALEKID